MKKSYLIQRLTKPLPKSWKHKRNPFNFGCGLVNGGLSEKAAKMLDNIFQFLFMGAYEFEDGSVPKALAEIWDNHEQYITFDMNVPYVYKEYMIRKRKIIKGKASVYVICRPEWKEYIIKFIKSKAAHPYSKNYPVKEYVLLNSSLAKPDSKACGWLELDNGYFFFTNLEMYKKILKLFNIKEKG